MAYRVRTGTAVPQHHGRHPKRAEILALGLAGLLWLGGVHAAEISGIVTEVQDGDTITLANWQHTYRIRLTDIDAPELKQPRGKDSRAALFHLCALKQAVVETQGEDRFGRTLGRLTCAGVNANAEQVRQGWAWVFVRYAPKDSPLFALESEARLGRRGLWMDDAPVPPWEWRRNSLKGE